MPSTYLSPDEYPETGSTIEAVQSVCAAIDLYLDRPQGLVWTPDVTGLPTYMAAAEPVLTLALGTDLPIGANITVAVANAGLIQPGEVLIVDRGTDALVEALVVSATTEATLTFAAVVRAHSAGATIESGMVLQDKATASRRNIIRLDGRPVVKVMSATAIGHYGAWNPLTVNLAGPNQIMVDAPYASRIFDDLRLYHDREIMVRYIAGFTANTIPLAIKSAALNMLAAQSYADDLGLPTNVKTYAAGGTKIERFSSSNIDIDTQRLLNPYRSASALLR